MASDMLDNLQRLACLDIDKLELGLLGYLKSEFIDNITGMSEIFRLGELFFTRIPEILANLCLKLRIFMSCLERLGVASERCDT